MSSARRSVMTSKVSIVALAAMFGVLVACEERPAPEPAPEPTPTPEPGPTPGPQALCPPLEEPDTNQLAALTARAEEDGAVRVIVRVATPSMAQPVQVGGAPPSNQQMMAMLGERQTDAVQALRSAGVERVETISPRLPYVVAEMTAAEIEAAYPNGQFVSWTEDRIAFPTLIDSGPLVEAPQLWDLGGRGAGQAVAILDTGVDASHPFLGGRVVAEACFSTNSALNGATSLCEGGASEEIGEGAGAPCAEDGCAHGTHVAGIAAGSNDNFSGVAPDADIVAVQVFSRFEGRACGALGGTCIASFTSDQIRALDYVLQVSEDRSVAAANMSLGGSRSTGYCDSDLTKPVIDQLRAAGVATAIASGNEGYRNAVSFPGCVSSAVTVGATSKSDQLAGFSNCGIAVDLHAPGVSINSSIPGGGFARFNGTSMAAPHVAGAFAALKSLHPEASVDEIEAALKSGGVDVEGRPRIALLEAENVLDQVQVAVMAKDEDQEPGVDPLHQAIAALDAIPDGERVRVIVGVKAPAGASVADVAAAVSVAETAARQAGAVQVERIGSQPLLVVEGTKEDCKRFAEESGVVASMQVDRISRAN